MSLHTAPPEVDNDARPEVEIAAPPEVELEAPSHTFSWPACTECGSSGPFGVGKVIVLPAGPSHAIVPVVCRCCGDVRLFAADSLLREM